MLIAATALGLVVLSGWPSSLYYGNKADSAVKLQEDFDKAVEHKSHLHKHYHRQSPNTHSSNELNEVQSNIVVNNQPDKHPAGTEKSVTEATEEEETEIKDPKVSNVFADDRLTGFLSFILHLMRLRSTLASSNLSLTIDFIIHQNIS